MREIVFDTETTGVDPLTGDRVVEIGCIELMGRVPTGRTFHAYFNPERPMPAGAEAVHGLSDRFLADKPRFAERVDEIVEFFGDSQLIAHNAAFDFAFLDVEFERCGRSCVDRIRMVDTMMLAKRCHPTGKWSLDALCSRYGIDRSARIKHGALLDAELLAQVYVELTGGRQIGLSLTEREPVGATVAVSARPSYAHRRPRPHAASLEELARHQAFVAGLAEALWSGSAQRA